MTETTTIDHEVALEEKCVMLWSHQVKWVKENDINLGSMLRVLLQKEIRRSEKGVSS